MREPRILAAYVLGSVVSGHDRVDSDFDLAVVVDSRRKVSDEEVYELIKSINFPRDLDLSVVDKSSSPLFLFQMISRGRRVYERSEAEVNDFEAFVMRNYYDTAHIRNIYHSYLGDKFGG